MLNNKLNPPSPYFNKEINLKAFVLGCDPTAFTKNDHKNFKTGKINADDRLPIIFDTVFDLNNGLKYFSGINVNLEELGLKYKEDIYVQNLVPEYQKEETSKNKQWKTIAISKIPDRQKEFDEIDRSGKLPVFLTSALLYKVLLKNKKNHKTPGELYNPDGEIIIPASENRLARPLIPLFRHYNYSLSEHTEYKEKLIGLLCSMS